MATYISPDHRSLREIPAKRGEWFKERKLKCFLLKGPHNPALELEYCAELAKLEAAVATLKTARAWQGLAAVRNINSQLEPLIERIS